MQEIINTILYDDTNLQGYWRMEDNGNDSSGNGYNLTASGAPSYATGKFGKAIDLERTNTQYLSGTGFTNVAKNGNRTFMAWINIESIVGNPCLFRVAGATAGLWDILINGTPAKIIARQKQSTVLTNYIGTKEVNIAQWQFIAVVFDETNMKVRIYVNGEKDELTMTAVADALTGTLTTWVGFDGGGDYTDGLVDEVVMFDRALTDTEVLDHYYGRNASGGAFLLNFV